MRKLILVLLVVLLSSTVLSACDSDTDRVKLAKSYVSAFEKANTDKIDDLTCPTLEGLGQADRPLSSRLPRGLKSVKYSETKISDTQYDVKVSGKVDWAAGYETFQFTLTLAKQGTKWCVNKITEPTP